MKSTRQWYLIVGSCLLIGLTTHNQQAPGKEPSGDQHARIAVKIKDKSLHKIDARIFGQFMERPSWGGETGVEGSLLPGTNKLQNKTVELIKGMHIPIIRFPGGTDVDYLD